MASPESDDPQPESIEASLMRRAIELARCGEGRVEPNPMVGCVLIQGGRPVGEGWHKQYGGPHAEVEALRQAGPMAKGATAFVTLEPCAHFGKTPPCADALVKAGVARVVCAMQDPFPQVAGQGFQKLRQAGIRVECGLLEAEARDLNAPYLKRLARGRPWVVAKWAMTLDGRICSRTGDSQWISSPESRERVHALRGRVDGVLVGAGTALADDPLLTARPPGVRTATRVVVDSLARLPLEGKLVRSASEGPVLIAVGEAAPPEKIDALTAAGCEVFRCLGDSTDQRLEALLDELGRRRWTNLLVEGGSRILGALFDLGEIDEVHVFVAPKLVGGASALGPLGGRGHEKMSAALALSAGSLAREFVGPDVHFHGRIAR